WREARWAARPWRSNYVNHATYITNVTNIYNNNINYINRFPLNHNTYLNNRQIVPINARYAAGTTLANIHAFGGRGRYQAVPRDDVSVFTRGRAIAAPSAGRPFAGPPAVRPTPLALPPTRTFTQDRTPPQNMLRRPVFRAPIRGDIAR